MNEKINYEKRSMDFITKSIFKAFETPEYKEEDPFEVSVPRHIDWEAKREKQIENEVNDILSTQ